jgi:dihydroxyacetone kinase
MELGLGVHGEAGVASVPLASAREAVDRLLAHMMDPASATGLQLAAGGERLAVLLNNLGGTSKLEELVVGREVVRWLEARGHAVVRLWAGHMMTSLEMAGVLVSVLKVTDRPEWLELLDTPTLAPAWPVVLRAAAGGDRVTPARVAGPEEVAEVGMVRGARLSAEGEEKARAAIEAITDRLIKMEAELNVLDSGSGDGDCGSTLAAGARALQAALPSLALAHPLALLHELAGLAEGMGGSSGGLYSILLTAASRAFRDQVTG